MIKCCVEGCERSDIPFYKINEEGGFGLPEAWCCRECMSSAEDGSRVQRMRDSLYHDDFPEFEKIEIDGIY